MIVQLPRGKRRGSLPRRHQQREIPWNDLADDAERFLEMVGDSFVVDRGDRSFLGPDAAGEIPEMIDGKRNVGASGLANRLSVVERLGKRQKLQILFHAVGDLVEQQRSFSRRHASPGIFGLVGCVERHLDGVEAVTAAMQLRTVAQRPR